MSGLRQSLAQEAGNLMYPSCEVTVRHLLKYQ